MVFSYKREHVTVEAYGKVFPIPTKTAVLVDGVNDIQKRLGECKNAVESVEVTLEGIALFIGEKETEEIFPKSAVNELDTDELAAFWWALNNASNSATKEIIAKYSPNANIRKEK